MNTVINARNIVAKTFVLSAFAIFLVAIPVAAHAQEDYSGSYDTGSSDYSGSYDTGSSDYSGSYDTGSSGYSGSYDTGSSGYSGSYDTGAASAGYSGSYDTGSGTTGTEYSYAPDGSVCSGNCGSEYSYNPTGTEYAYNPTGTEYTYSPTGTEYSYNPNAGTEYAYNPSTCTTACNSSYSTPVTVTSPSYSAQTGYSQTGYTQSTGYTGGTTYSGGVAYTNPGVQTQTTRYSTPTYYTNPTTYSNPNTYTNTTPVYINNVNTNTNTNVAPVYPAQPQYQAQYVYQQPNQYAPQQPVHPYYTAPVTPTVALSQIPYTGFDFGTTGDAIYWASLASFAIAASYLLIYYKGGALAFASSVMPVTRRTYPARFVPVHATEEVEETAVEAPAHIASEVSVAPTAPTRAGTMDAMQITHGVGGMPRIVINRA